MQNRNMTLNEWKIKLLPAGILLACYFVLPGVVGGFMGRHNALFGGFSVSLLIQTGLGLAFVSKLFGLKQFLGGELAGWLGRFAQPPDKTRELAEKVLLAGGVVCIIAVVGPPLGEMLPDSGLMTFAKLAALGYTCYLCYDIWKLAEPFMAYAPAAALPGGAEEEQASAASKARRCPKCGQLMGEADTFCAFCKHTAP